jgi:hypothetical protein
MPFVRALCSLVDGTPGRPVFTDTRRGDVDLGADSPVGGAELATYSKPRLIGIGAAVTCRPLPHHRANGSVHGGSRSYVSSSRTVKVVRVSGSRHSKLRLIEPWNGPGTRGHDHYRPYWRLVANVPRVAATRPGDDGGIFHCRQSAHRSLSRTQRIRPISTSGVSQKPK